MCLGENNVDLSQFLFVTKKKQPSQLYCVIRIIKIKKIMKTVAIIFLVLISVKSFSQNDLKKTNQMKKVSFTNEGTTKVQAHNKGQYVSSGNKIIKAKTVTYYDSYISSIKTKMKHIKSDEVENKKAIESGWYEEMKLNIANAEIEKQKLLIVK